VAHSVLTRGPGGLFNDFYAYWGAAALLNRGHDPYDIGALAAVQRGAGLQVTTGSGYSYPLFFAELLRPLGLVEPHLAAAIFTAISLVAIVIAVGLLLGSWAGMRPAVLVVAGAIAGLFPPLIGSLYFGQANLLVLVPLALAFRSRVPEGMVALAATVKLYPASGLIASIVRRRWAAVAGAIALLAILVAVPQALNRGSLLPRTGYFLGPDTYWSNESINGFLSRLALPSTWTRPPLPGLPVEALLLTLAGLLLIAVVVITVRGGDRPYAGCLALSLWLGSVVAPKNSLWNFTPLLLGIAFAFPLLRYRPPPLLAGAAGWLMIEVQAQLDSARETVYRSDPGLTWLSSIGLYGALLIGVVIAWALLTPRRRPLPRPSPSPGTRGTSRA
jgi:hypothetical protein